MKTYKELIKEDVQPDREKALVQVRVKVNNALIKGGLDGNGRFPHLTAIQSKVDSVLNNFGFSCERDKMMSVGNTGHLALPIIDWASKAYEIKNRKLSIQWELRNPHDNDPKQWAAICYVS